MTPLSLINMMTSKLANSRYKPNTINQAYQCDALHSSSYLAAIISRTGKSSAYTHSQAFSKSLKFKHIRVNPNNITIDTIY